MAHTSHIPALNLPSRSRYSFTDPERIHTYIFWSKPRPRVQRATGPRLLRDRRSQLDSNLRPRGRWSSTLTTRLSRQEGIRWPWREQQINRGTDPGSRRHEWYSHGRVMGRHLLLVGHHLRGSARRARNAARRPPDVAAGGWMHEHTNKHDGSQCLLMSTLHATRCNLVNAPRPACRRILNLSATEGWKAELT